MMNDIREIASEPMCAATWYFTVQNCEGLELDPREMYCSSASGRVCGAGLEITEEAECRNTEFLNILI